MPYLLGLAAYEHNQYSILDPMDSVQTLGYCRESKENMQALRNQVRQLKRAGCRRVLSDVMSGQRDDRVGFNKALQLLRSSQYNVFKVPRIDRLSRVLQTHMELASEFRSLGIRFEALDYGPIDISTPLGWQSLINAAVSSEYYSRQLSHNVKMGKQGAREKGWFIGSTTPFGLMRSDCGHHLRINPDEIEIANARWKIFLETKNFGETARRLFEKYGHKVGQNTLNTWISNPHVRGHIFYGKTVELNESRGRRQVESILYNKHPAIIPPDAAKEIDQILKDNSSRRGNARKNPPHPLSGLCLCKGCGQVMCLARTKKPSGKVFQYIKHKGKYPNRPCDSKGAIRVEAVEAAIAQKFASKANEIIQREIRVAEMPPSAELVAARDELKIAYDAARKIKSVLAEQLVQAAEEKVANLEKGEHAFDMEYERREKIILSLQNPLNLTEMSEQKRRHIYTDLIRVVWTYNGKIVEIKLKL